MLLQIGGRHLRGHLPLHDAMDDRSLLLTPGHQHDALGTHDGLQAHRNGHARRTLHVGKVLRLDHARIVGQLHQARARFPVRARLIEAHLAILTHTDDHQVDLARRLLIRIAILREALFGHAGIYQVDILGQDVNMVEQLLADTEVAALRIGRINRIELIERADRHVAERDLARLITAHQLPIEAHRRASGSQTQDEGLLVVVDLVGEEHLVVVADRLDDHIRHILHPTILIVIDLRTNTFVTTQNIARCDLQVQTTIFGKRIFVVHSYYFLCD